ncbi:MAG: DNA double-strand break repair nuclease NurA [Anaerolineales bacterium]|nr:DNA double-strand break repair nuclease NurA [Anaerolineales bacterium]
MSLDYQQVREQIKSLGESATGRAARLQNLRVQAGELLRSNAGEIERLRQKVNTIVRNHDPNLRCALPAWGPDGEAEPLDGHYSLPPLPEQATILAADGSQISPDRHAAVNFCLINVGTIQMRLNDALPPEITTRSQLLYDEDLYTETGGMLSEAQVALMRDLNERERLKDLASKAAGPVITFTDGPMELWGAGEGESSEFKKSLEKYMGVLENLSQQGVITAGYVDKPAANLMVRLLEIAMLPGDQLAQVKRYYPLRGVIDRDLFQGLLAPGERSAVFAIQSRSVQNYRGELALHFFYLNVGRTGHPWLARVEIPAWVASERKMLDHLHAVLVHQCTILGSRPFPYLLHRAHEAAVVTLEEKEQVTQMILLELRNRGIEVGEMSQKQAVKNLQGRTTYER